MPKLVCQTPLSKAPPMVGSEGITVSDSACGPVQVGCGAGQGQVRGCQGHGRALGENFKRPKG